MSKLKLGLTKLKSWYKSLNKTKRIALLLAVVLVLTTGVAGATTWWFYNRFTDLDRAFSDIDWGNSDFPDVDEVFEGRVLNILLMGFDRNEARDAIYSAFRPDTLMVAAINLDTGKVDLVSIPRDSLVPIYDRGGGRDKINHSYYYGWAASITGITDPDERHQSGLNSVVETVSMALKGVPIHYYVSVCMEGVMEIVDIMGGVWYDVPFDLIHHRTGEVLVTEGYQKLDGRQFLDFVRNRTFEGGDVRRTQHQQAILIAAFDQFKRANKLIHAPQVYMNMRNNLETNLTLDQIAALAFFATRNISAANITTHTMPGKFAYGRVHEGQTATNIYYLIDQQGRADLLKQVWGIDVQPDAPDKLLPRLRPDDEPVGDSEDFPVEEEPNEDPGDAENDEESNGAEDGNDSDAEGDDEEDEGDDEKEEDENSEEENKGESRGGEQDSES